MPTTSKKSLNSSKLIHVWGEVFSGSGEAATFIKLPWVRKQIAEKLGFIPYSGTLNIRLTKNDVKRKKLLKKAKPIEISPATGFCHGICFKAYLNDNLKCAVVIPGIENYPEEVLEVIAPINLRDRLQLKDGDTIKVKIIL